MNYQSGKELDPVFKAAVLKRHNEAIDRNKDFLNRHNIVWDDLEYYAYPQSFSSTSGPSKGPGGQAFTNFTIHAFYDSVTGNAVLYCAGHYQICEEWTPFTRWKE
jgi:hypothetical protein